MFLELKTSAYAGACLCGQVRWTSTSSPTLQFNCHCVDCRKSTGAGFLPIMFFKAEDISITGDLAHFQSIGASGHPIRRSFCPGCGAQVIANAELMQGMLSIRAGTLTDISLFKPKASIFASHAANWAPPRPDLPSFARLPGQETITASAGQKTVGSGMADTQLLTRYKAWADDVFLTVVSKIPTADLVAPRPIIFGSLIRTLHHSLAMDYVWKCHLLGEHHGLTTRNPENCPDIGDLVENQRNMDAWYVEWASSMSCSNLQEPVSFEFIGGGSGCMTRRDILLHVVNHTTYHRGHAAGMLYDIGVFPPATDLPVFLSQNAGIN